MLPAASKLRHPQEFAAVVRRGRRASTRHLVVHLLPAAVGSDQNGRSGGSDAQHPPRAGFVISGNVGNSVVRHRITRQLRPLVRDRLATLPAGTDLVIRALPAAVGASSSALATDLDTGLSVAVRKAAGSRPAGARR